MPLVLANRVQETGTANTTVSFTLTGAVPGFQSFATIGNTNTTYYSATDGSSNWEVGLGTYSTTGPTLTRTTIYASSNAGSAVTFSGVVSVFVTYPSGRSVNLDASGNVSALGTVASGTWQGSTIGVAYGGTGVTASSGANSVMLRDANQNTSINRLNQSNTSVTASGGTTALTAASSYSQTLNGTGNHTFTMPDATTLTTGVAFIFNNNATGTLTLQDYATGSIGTVTSGGACELVLLANGTTGGTWDVHGFLPENVTWGTNALALGSTVISGGTWQGGTIQSGYGGTGLTTFAGANNALYSTSASALAAGTLPIAAGGTGATTRQDAMDALAGAVTSGQYLRGNGTDVVMSAIQTADVPTLNQNTTGSAATLTTGRTIAITGDLAYTSPSFDGSTNVTAAGTLATVNSNVGSFTNASVTVNGKGLVTAVSSGTAPVTSVSGTSPVASSGGATPVISLASGYGDTQNPYASKTANFVLAAPNGTAGVPTFRAVVAADIPTLNQNTTGTAANVTGIVAVANGGTGTATPALVAGTNITITGSFPNQTINSTASGSGTVTSVAATVPSFLSVSGSPITTSGTLAFSLASTPTNGQLLIGNGTGFSYSTLTAGSNITITNSSGGITIASTGGGLTQFTAAESTTAPNGTVYVDSLTAAAASTNADVAFVAKGTGATLAQVPDSTTTGGNKRGTYATDWQKSRTAANQVASGTSSTIAGGENNRAGNIVSFVGGGGNNSSINTGAAIAGGYSNTASGGYSAIVGGASNTASSPYAFVGGGSTNAAQTATTGYNVVVGGANNIASGDYSFVGGGGDAVTTTDRNTASGVYAVVTGGKVNTASSPVSFVGGGSTNTATTASTGYNTVVGGLSNAAIANYSFVGGGSSNIASGQYSAIAGGTSNTASGTNAAIFGGSGNTADARGATVNGGENGATRSIVGNAVFPACSQPISGVSGTSQAALLILAVQTTNATATVLRSNTSAATTTNQVILPNNSAYYFRGSITAGVTGGGNSAMWSFEGGIKRGANAAATTLIQSVINPVAADSGASTWIVALSADTTNGGLAVTVTGQASTTIRWVCKIETTEMTF